MRLFSHLFIAAVLLSLSATAFAQDSLAFQWDAASISLNYPAAWNEPLPDDQNGQLVLQLAQVLVDSSPESRPPGVPMITLTLFTDGMPQDGNLLPFLYAALQGLGIDATEEPADITFLGEPGLQLTGTSADSQLFGIAQVAALNDADVLVIVGRAVEAQREDFAALFTAVASSVTASGTGTTEVEATPDISTYGVLWYTQRTLADAEDAFLNLVGLAYTPGDRLYTYEVDLGVVQMDATTGSVLSITPNDHITDPADIAAAADGTVYVADTTCACVFTLTPGGTWLDQADNTSEEEAPEFDPETSAGLITGFGEDAPAHLAVGSDGALYATNSSSAGTISVRVFEGGALSHEIRFADDVTEQPLLSTVPSGDIDALTQTGELLALVGTQATLIGTPVTGPSTALAITADGNVVIVSPDRGVSILTPDGDGVDQPGSLVPDSPQPGEMVAPHSVAVDSTDRLFVADSDGTFGAITAMSLTVPADRIGSSDLIPGLAVQGLLNEATPRQAWTYAGTAGQRITLTAVDNTGAGVLDVALHLIDPSGVEIASNDDHESADLANFTDAQIFDAPLPVDGPYTVIVEAVGGEGAYSLGLTLTRALTLDASSTARATGQLGAVFPTDVWEFGGSAGQILTITLQATDGDLDTVLRLIGPDGTLLAENDDADDSALATNSQLVAVGLPEDGTYRLEAARYDGAGHYSLTLTGDS